MVDNDAISKGVLLGREGGLCWKMVWPNGVVANRDVRVSNANKVPSLRHLRKHEHSSTHLRSCGWQKSAKVPRKRARKKHFPGYAHLRFSGVGGGSNSDSEPTTGTPQLSGSASANIQIDCDDDAQWAGIAYDTRTARTVQWDLVIFH